MKKRSKRMRQRQASGAPAIQPGEPLSQNDPIGGAPSGGAPAGAIEPPIPEENLSFEVTPKRSETQPLLARQGLAEEIDILRRAVRKLYNTSEGQDEDQSVRTLNILSVTAARLARLVETQSRLPEGSQDDGLTAAFLTAIAEMCPENTHDSQTT